MDAGEKQILIEAAKEIAKRGAQNQEERNVLIEAAKLVAKGSGWGGGW